MNLLALCFVLPAPAQKLPTGDTVPSVVGRLARSTRVTDVHARATRSSATLSRIPVGRHLVVKPQPTEGWLPIVMTDRRIAYVRADAVKLLPYEYVEKNPSAVAALPDAERSGTGDAIAEFARKAVGLRRPEASGKGAAERESGEFVRTAYAVEGYDLPTLPAEQAKRGTSVKNFEDLSPGDRVYLWNARTERIGEAAIYVGGGYVVMFDAAKKATVLRYLDERLRKRVVAGRRRPPRSKAYVRGAPVTNP